MTILGMAQKCAERLQIPSPSTLVDSTDNNIILLRAMMIQSLREIRDSYPWPELQKEYLITLTTNTASYPLPGDFDWTQNETLWNRSQHWPLLGPIDAVEWQVYKSGLVVSLPRQRFRVKGWATNQFFIDPTPDSTLNGQTVVFEYISRTCVAPRTWVASTSWTGDQYCSYNGNIYDRGSTAAANTGTSAPVHTSGSASDGSITWTYVSTQFENFSTDSDDVILDKDLVMDGAVWRFKRERGLDYQGLMEDSLARIEKAKTNLSGAGVLMINKWHQSPPLIGPWSYPEGNYGV